MNKKVCKKKKKRIRVKRTKKKEKKAGTKAWKRKGTKIRLAGRRKGSKRTLQSWKEQLTRLGRSVNWSITKDLITQSHFSHQGTHDLMTVCNY